MRKRSGEFTRGVSIQPGASFSAAAWDRALRAALAPFIENAQTLVILVDKAGRLVAGNPAYERLKNWLPQAERLEALVLPADRQLLATMIASAHTSKVGARVQMEFGLPGSVIRCSCLAVPASRGATLILAEPAQPQADLLEVNAELASELARLQESLDRKTAELRAVLAQADEMAHTDSLTLLPNRRSIIADLQRQVTYAERYETPLAVSMLDLDGFKNINDQYGHSVGDKVLVSVARGLRDRIRQPDQVGRYGGDEFLVILPNSIAMAASEQAARLCQYVRSTSFSFTAEPEYRITLSIGIAQFGSGEDWRALLERADRALYEAKRQGGDRWLILES